MLAAHTKIRGPLLTIEQFASRFFGEDSAMEMRGFLYKQIAASRLPAIKLGKRWFIPCAEAEEAMGRLLRATRG